MEWQTTKAYLSGGLCGSLWMPSVDAGVPIRVDIRREFERFSEPASFRDVLLHVLMEHGGDFQNAEFTGDTQVCIVRSRTTTKGRYEMHERSWDVAALKDCADLVREDSYVSDYMGEE